MSYKSPDGDYINKW